MLDQIFGPIYFGETWPRDVWFTTEMICLSLTIPFARNKM